QTVTSSLLLQLSASHYALHSFPTRRSSDLGLVALNVVSLLWLRYRADINNRELLIALALDVAALTALLYLSGGATNPFTSLYLLQVTLGAVLLDAPST